MYYNSLLPLSNISFNCSKTTITFYDQHNKPISYINVGADIKSVRRMLWDEKCFILIVTDYVLLVFDLECGKIIKRINFKVVLKDVLVLDGLASSSNEEGSMERCMGVVLFASAGFGLLDLYFSLDDQQQAVEANGVEATEELTTEELRRNSSTTHYYRQFMPEEQIRCLDQFDKEKVLFASDKRFFLCDVLKNKVTEIKSGEVLKGERIEEIRTVPNSPNVLVRGKSKYAHCQVNRKNELKRIQVFDKQVVKFLNFLNGDTPMSVIIAPNFIESYQWNEQNTMKLHSCKQINMNPPPRDARILKDSIHPNQSFVIELFEKKIHRISILPPDVELIDEIMDTAPQIFNGFANLPENLSVKNPVSILNYLWDKNLYSVITKYVLDKSNSGGRNDYTLKNPTIVFDWIKATQKSIVNNFERFETYLFSTDLKRVNENLHTDASNYLFEASRKLEALRSICSVLQDRIPSNDQGKLEVVKLHRIISNRREKFLVLHWFLENEIVPTAMFFQRINDPEISRNITFVKVENGVERFEEVPCTLLREELLTFALTGKDRSEFEYPPESIPVLLSIFNGEQDVAENLYRHLMILYFIIHDSFEKHSTNLAVVSNRINSYAQRFSISDEWQKLIFGFYLLDTADENTVLNNDDLQYFCTSLQHPWTEEIFANMVASGQFVIARFYYEQNGSEDTRLAIKVLIANSMFNEALFLQRSEPNQEKRVNMFCDILREGLIHKRTKQLFSFQFDDFERETLINFYMVKKEYQKLFAYFVLNFKFSEAKNLYDSIKGPKQIDPSMIDNLKKILYPIQETSMHTSWTSKPNPTLIHQLPTNPRKRKHGTSYVQSVVTKQSPASLSSVEDNEVVDLISSSDEN